MPRSYFPRFLPVLSFVSSERLEAWRLPVRNTPTTLMERHVTARVPVNATHMQRYATRNSVRCCFEFKRIATPSPGCCLACVGHLVDMMWIMHQLLDSFVPPASLKYIGKHSRRLVHQAVVSSTPDRSTSSHIEHVRGLHRS